MANCALCGKKTSFFKSSVIGGNVDIDRTILRNSENNLFEIFNNMKSETICSDCIKKLFWLYNNDTEYENTWIYDLLNNKKFSNEVDECTGYVDNIIKNADVQSACKQRINEIKNIAVKYDNWDKIIEALYNYNDRIKQEIIQGVPNYSANFDKFWVSEESGVFHHQLCNENFIKAIEDIPFGYKRIDIINQFKIEVNNGDILEVNAEDIIKIEKIPLNNILYYKVDGNISYTEAVKNKGNGNNALIGGILFGATGAQIGASYDLQVTSETKEHDNRVIIFKYKDENDKITENVFPYAEYYDIFKALIPEKEYSVVMMRKGNEVQNEQPKQAKTELSPIEKIRQLKELVDIGAVTQEEFEEQKKRLLNQI